MQDDACNLPEFSRPYACNDTNCPGKNQSTHSPLADICAEDFTHQKGTYFFSFYRARHSYSRQDAAAWRAPWLRISTHPRLSSRNTPLNSPARGIGRYVRPSSLQPKLRESTFFSSDFARVLALTGKALRSYWELWIPVFLRVRNPHACAVTCC